MERDGPVMAVREYPGDRTVGICIWNTKNRVLGGVPHSAVSDQPENHQVQQRGRATRPVEKPCSEKWPFCRASKEPDFLSLFLWSLYLVTREVGCVATGFRTNKDTLGGSE